MRYSYNGKVYTDRELLKMSDLSSVGVLQSCLHEIDDNTSLLVVVLK